MLHKSSSLQALSAHAPTQKTGTLETEFCRSRERTTDMCRAKVLLTLSREAQASCPRATIEFFFPRIFLHNHFARSQCTGKAKTKSRATQGRPRQSKAGKASLDARTAGRLAAASWQRRIGETICVQEVAKLGRLPVDVGCTMEWQREQPMEEAERKRKDEEEKKRKEAAALEEAERKRKDEEKRKRE